MKKLEANVIIWGNDNYNVLGLLRQLTPYVENVFFLVNQKARGCATKSKYCKKQLAAKTQDEAIEYLLKEGKKFDGKAFLITTSDLLAETVDLHSSELSRYYILSTTKKMGELTRFLDKEYQCTLAQRAGVDVPITKLLKRKTDLNELRNLAFPCLIKPAYKQQGVHHPFKTCICHNFEELKKAQLKLDRDGTYLLQEYIKKDFDLLLYGTRLDDGTVKYAGAFEKNRWARGDGSFGTIDERIPNYIDVNKIEQILSEIEYYGLFSVEFGVKDRVAWFYEFNLRNDGTSHYFYQAGLTNIPLLWVKSHINHKQAVFIDEVYDVDNIIENFVDKNEWKEQRQKATIFKYYDEFDKMPYYYMKVIKILSVLYHKIKK